VSETDFQTWLAISNKVGLPTSSTHTIVGSVVGFGVATLGTSGINWGWSGLGQILASWVIAPMIAGVAAAIIFMATKYAVLNRKNSLIAGLRMMPIYFAFTTGILTVNPSFFVLADL
jgi:solute carrier family 20 (sodium-dependent phosphate transporter)